MCKKHCRINCLENASPMFLLKYVKNDNSIVYDIDIFGHELFVVNTLPYAITILPLIYILYFTLDHSLFDEHCVVVK